MVSGKPSNKKTFKYSKNFNFFLVLLCLILVFLGKLDLIAIRNFKAFVSDFVARDKALESGDVVAANAAIHVPFLKLLRSVR